MFLYGDSLFHEYKNEFILEATINYSVDYLLVLGKFPPGKSPPINSPLENSPRKIPTQKIATWNIPAISLSFFHYFFT